MGRGRCVQWGQKDRVPASVSGHAGSHAWELWEARSPAQAGRKDTPWVARLESRARPPGLLQNQAVSPLSSAHWRQENEPAAIRSQWLKLISMRSEAF